MKSCKLGVKKGLEERKEPKMCQGRNRKFYTDTKSQKAQAKAPTKRDTETQKRRRLKGANQKL